MHNNVGSHIILATPAFSEYF